MKWNAAVMGCSVEEDEREEREQRTSINKKKYPFLLRFIDTSEPESLPCLYIFALTLPKSGQWQGSVMSLSVQEGRGS